MSKPVTWIPGTQDLVLDAVCAAINQGIEQADKNMEAELDKITGGVKIPGMV